MKGTDEFTKTIKAFLDEYAEKDNLFQTKYANPKKDIDECITYIINTVKISERNGFTDDEIFNMAIHYYDEDNIELGEKINCLVKVNHHIEFTEEEKSEMRQKAIDRLITEQAERLKRKPVQRKDDVIPEQQSLFE